MVGPKLGTLPSEWPLSFCAPISACPKLFRTLSSKPGSDARCFLNGEAKLAGSVPASVAVGALALDDGASAGPLGTGVPE